MAEFCLDCWNKMNETNDSEKKYIISKELDFCEGCGQWKPVIIMERRAYYMRKFRYFILPFRIMYNILIFACRLLMVPYVLFKYFQSKNDDTL